MPTRVVAVVVLRASKDCAMVAVRVEEREEGFMDLWHHEFPESHGACLLSRRDWHINVADDGKLIGESKISAS